MACEMIIYNVCILVLSRKAMFAHVLSHTTMFARRCSLTQGCLHLGDFPHTSCHHVFPLRRDCIGQACYQRKKRQQTLQSPLGSDNSSNNKPLNKVLTCMYRSIQLGACETPLTCYLSYTYKSLTSTVHTECRNQHLFFFLDLIDSTYCVCITILHFFMVHVYCNNKK